MPNNSSALFWKASAIFSKPNWKETTIKEFKNLFLISKSISKVTSVIPLFLYINFQLFVRWFNGPSMFLTKIESFFLSKENAPWILSSSINTSFSIFGGSLELIAFFFIKIFLIDDNQANWKLILTRNNTMNSNIWK